MQLDKMNAMFVNQVMEQQDQLLVKHVVVFIQTVLHVVQI